MSWSGFFNGFAGAWVLLSLAAIPLAGSLYSRNPRNTYKEKMAGNFIFWATVILAPFVIVHVIARYVDEQD